MQSIGTCLHTQAPASGYGVISLSLPTMSVTRTHPRQNKYTLLCTVYYPVYGLTETTGGAIAAPENTEDYASVGVPVAMMQVKVRFVYQHAHEVLGRLEAFLIPAVAN